MSSTKDTGSTEEAEEQRLLAQNKSDIEEVLKLIEEQTDRSEAERRLKEAQAKVDARHKGKVFHTHQSRKIPLHHHTSNLLQLAETLELSLNTRRHCEDLHKALGAMAQQRVRLLRRMMQRDTWNSNPESMKP